MLFRQYTKF